LPIHAQGDGNFADTFCKYTNVQNETIMSPFLIFAVILTLAYVFYYATVIAMDLHSMQNKTVDSAETIPVADTKDDTKSKPVIKNIVAKTVVEDMENGGFSIIDTSQVSEIEDEMQYNNGNDNIAEETPQEPAAFQEPLEGPHEPEVEPQEIPSAPESVQEENTIDDAHEDDVEPTEEDDEQQSNITTVAFVKDLSCKKPDVPFDENKAFEPAPEPTYGISQICGSKTNPLVEAKINDINQSLLVIEAKGDEVISLNLAETIRAHNKYAKEDEITHC
jgi:hypothetical protein